MKLTLEQALNKYQSNVYKAAFYICGNPEDAEDVAQEVFLAYYNTGTDYTSEEHIRSWLLKVAVNKARNLRKSFWTKRRIDIPHFTEWLEAYTQEQTVEYDDESIELIKAVMSLPDKCRIAVHLFYYEDYSVKQIAGVMGVKENTVKAHLHRGRTLLKSMLKENWENE